MLRKFFPRIWLQWRLWRINACPAACRWARGFTIEEAWAECPREDWMRFWLRQHAHIEPLLLLQLRRQTILEWSQTTTDQKLDYVTELDLDYRVQTRLRRDFTADGSSR